MLSKVVVAVHLSIVLVLSYRTNDDQVSNGNGLTVDCRRPRLRRRHGIVLKDGCYSRIRRHTDEGAQSTSRWRRHGGRCPLAMKESAFVRAENEPLVLDQRAANSSAVTVVIVSRLSRNCPGINRLLGEVIN